MWGGHFSKTVSPDFQSRHQSASDPSLPLMAREAHFDSSKVKSTLKNDIGA
jgi:hypothetical protein